MEKNVIVVASVLGIQSPSGLQLIHGNRTVTDLKHVAKIKEAMKRGEIVPPIIIDKLTKLSSGEVTEEQHKAIIDDCTEYIKSAKEMCNESNMDWSVCILLSRTNLDKYVECKND